MWQILSVSIPGSLAAKPFFPKAFLSVIISMDSQKEYKGEFPH